MLTALGFLKDPMRAVNVIPEQDTRMHVTERMLRIFIRTTQVNDEILRAKLGKQFSIFENICQQLLDAECCAKSSIGEQAFSDGFALGFQ